MKRSGLWLLLLAALLAVAAAVAVAQTQLDEGEWLQPSLVEELSAASASEAAAIAIDERALMEVEAEADAALAVEAEAEAENENEADSEAEAETETESEAEGELQTEAATDADADAEAEVDAAADAALMEVSSSRRGSGERRAKSPRSQFGSGPRARRSRRSLKVARRPGHGYGVAPRPVRRVQQRLPEARLTGAAATLTRANVRCVLCQYIAQKLKNSLTAGDANAAASAAAAPAAAAASVSLIESFAFASPSDEARIVSLVETAASADASAQAAAALPTVFDSGRESSRRFRHTDILAHRAGRARFTQVRANQPGKDTDATRAAYLRLYSTVYASFETLCAKRMPLAYLPYCNDMLKSYRFFAQGVNYGDRAEQICMNGNFCDARSYIRRVTHNTYQREPGDA